MSESESLQTCYLYEFSVFTLDRKEGLFARGEPVKLAPKVLQTLTYFVENPGRLITKNELFDAVWTDSFVEDGALSFNISKLRKTLAEFDPDTEFIETVSKRGFRFIADVREVRPENDELEILIERRQVQELIAEEEHFLDTDTRPKLAAPARSRLKTAAFVAGALLMIGGVAGLVWQGISQNKKNTELKSVDSLPSVELFSWRSAGSSIHSQSSVSHNGNMVAYSSTQDGRSTGIFVKQIDGPNFRITNDLWTNFSPVWSPDDGQIAYVSYRAAVYGIYRCPSLGGPPTLIREIEGELRLTDWSRDGSALFYESDGNLFRIDLISREILQITAFEPGGETTDFAISRDEQQIAYCVVKDDQTDIWIKPLEGGDPFRLTNDADMEFRPKWHPDGKRVFYSVIHDNFYQISVLSTGGGEPARVTRGDVKYELIDVSSDGSKIFYKKWIEKFDIWQIKTEQGQESAVVSEPVYEYWPDLSPSGKYISYQMTPTQYMRVEMHRSSIFVRELDGNRATHTFKGSGQKWIDDQRIAFFRWDANEKKYNLWFFDTVSGGERQVTFNGIGSPGYPVFPLHRLQTSYFDWSANGDRLIYVDNKGKNLFLISLSDGQTTNLTNSEDPKTLFWCPIWSPDGNRAAFVSATTSPGSGQMTWRLWIYENGSPQEIHQGPKTLRLLGWSASGEQVFFEATDGPRKAGFMDVDLVRVSMDRETAVIGSLKEIAALSMTLSSDGTEAAYVSRPEGRDSIYTISTTSKATRQIITSSDPDTHFGSLTWSPDGKTLFVDKQEEINIISMFQNFK